jgi:glycogen operon protein
VNLRAGASLTVSVHAPDARELTLTVRSRRDGQLVTTPMARSTTQDQGTWSATVPAVDGDHYWLMADGVGPLVDPAACQVAMIGGRPLGVVRTEPWPRVPPLEPHRRAEHPVIYEVHVKGFARTFAGLVHTLPYLAELGVDVIELMPIHPFDTSDNYWGYMPIVWGALHEPYAAGTDAAAELAALTTAAHAHGLEVWADVVFNHTGEGDPSRTTWSLRGLDDAHAYLRNPDGSYNDDAGCGNVADPSDPNIRALVLQALERYADLGIDGFRFDLASALTRDGGHLVRSIGDWAAARDVRLVAEPWDLAAYQVGHAFPDRRWAQWNDRFREDVRGFLRGEEGLVPGLVERVTGSPHLFDGQAWRSVNFITAHDGLTLHDLTTVTDDRRRAWDCGPELRPQQLANAFCYLLLSAGSAMFVMGDEFARTQDGHDNPYDIDSPLTWVDWGRLDEWRELHDTVRHLLRLRRSVDHSSVRCFGVNGAPDIGYGSRSLAWATGPLYVCANAWWEPLSFHVQTDGPWRLELATSPDTRLIGTATVEVAPRSVAVLVRSDATAPIS